MQRSVLFDERAAIDSHDFPSGESLAEHFACPVVFLWLGIGGVEHRIVQDEEIGIRGGQSFIVKGDGVGQWQSGSRR